jgi:hypothetical protein
MSEYQYFEFAAIDGPLSEEGLFLGWLADFDPDEWREPEDGAVVMPPIPAGLDQPSPALAALIKNFPVDPDALAVAAGLSHASTPDRIPIAGVLEGLSESEMPVDSLFTNLESGLSLDEYLDCFPDVTREQAVAVLEYAQNLTLQPAA